MRSVLMRNALTGEERTLIASDALGDRIAAEREPVAAGLWCAVAVDA